MIQSTRSGILLALAVLMFVVVIESSTQNIDKAENSIQIDKDDNLTEYHLDIQMNFIDSEIKENGKDVQETQPEKPIDIDHDYNNTTSSTEKNNYSTLNETVENNVTNEVPIYEIPTPEVQQQSPKIVNETNTKIDNLGQTVESVTSGRTTTASNLDEKLSTLNPLNEKISLIDSTPGTLIVDTAHVETQTQSTEILQETSTSYVAQNRQDLSIYFENEPSRARQLRGFKKEIDNEVIAHSNSELESESDSSSSILKSSESESAHLSENSSGQDENKAVEDSSLSLDISHENTPTEPKFGSFDGTAIEDPVKSDVKNSSVEEIDAVTESTGAITDVVTVIANEETHTIMKKPGVDEESPKIASGGLIQEQTNEISATKTDNELDPVINIVLNRPKDVHKPSSTAISLTGNIQSVVEELNQNITNKFENKFLVPNVIVESNILDKSKDIDEDTNSVDLNFEIPGQYQEKNLGGSEEKKLPDLQTSLPHPENASTTNNNESLSGLNNILNTEIKNGTAVEENVLADNAETTTKKPLNKINEQSLLESNQTDQPSKEENGIFEELNTNSIIISTEKTIHGTIELEAPIDGNKIGPSREHITSSDSLLPMTTDETLPTILNEKYSSETNNLKDHIETSSQSSNESGLLGEIQEDQTIKIDNADETRLSPSDESLPDPKLYEQSIETSTEKPTFNKIDDPTASIETNQFGTTTDYARHVDSLQTMRDESSSVVSDQVIASASVAVAPGKPLPTRSAGDEPSSSSYSSEDKTTTVLVLCVAAGGIFVAFSFAIYLISFQRQHGTLDIEMQEQRCGKDNLDDDDDSETRVSLLNQIPTVDSDEHSSD